MTSRRSGGTHPIKRDSEAVEDDDDVNPNDIEAMSITDTARDYIMVAAIDFGTTFSGYAFSFKSKQDDITMYTEWGAGVGLSGYKAPTAILTDAAGKLVAFGYEAQKKYASLTEDDSLSYCYYEKFKMILKEGRNLSLQVKLKAKNGKSRPAVEVFAMTLEYLKDHLIEQLTKQSKT